MVDTDIEAITRARLRALRTSRGWSLDALAERSNLSPSTISRVETGKRTISLDVLVPLAAALGVSVDSLVTSDSDGDVVIRPVPTWHDSMTVWNLSRPGAETVAMKVRIDPTDAPPVQQVHPGHDWMYVLSGELELLLGERRLRIVAGEAAEFSTMTPHAFHAIEAGTEVVMVFNRQGEAAHVRSLEG